MSETYEDWMDRLLVTGLSCLVATACLLLELPCVVACLPVLAAVAACVWMALPGGMFGMPKGWEKAHTHWPLEEFAGALPDREVPQTRIAKLREILAGMGHEETASDVEGAVEVRVEVSEDYAHFLACRMVFDGAPRGYRCTVFRSCDGRGSIYVESYRSV